MHTEPIINKKKMNKMMKLHKKQPANHLISKEYIIDMTKATPNINKTKYLASLRSEKYS